MSTKKHDINYILNYMITYDPTTQYACCEFKIVSNINQNI